ncbi:prepilin-type N-terminal cleavage/methylation domain-containing protein [Deinococcus sp.]|uniref:prepilin-type N-terminal cleavage/methylation domain-containing protein n=1 Tax=Deinococcus sp. TaxID=47478 RepID=UPI0025C39B7C|nr:prepilin-type N-terminal cleavage/methylation domain-containing protein [Deinococcus sp.]
MQRTNRTQTTPTQTSQTPASHTQGFTIIEVLVAVFLTSVIALVVLTPLTGFFGLTRRSNQQVTATQQAQQVIEAVRGDWLSVVNYDQRCATQPIPATAQVTLTNLDVNGNSTGTPDLNATCGSNPPDTAPVRRINVQVTLGGATSSLSVDVARP